MDYQFEAFAKGWDQGNNDSRQGQCATLDYMFARAMCLSHFGALNVNEEVVDQYVAGYNAGWSPELFDKGVANHKRLQALYAAN